MKSGVWGPSVPHSWRCKPTEDSVLSCCCFKDFYCEGCDDQHMPGTQCSRSVLDDIADHLAFKCKSPKMLTSDIIGVVEARLEISPCNVNANAHIESRIDELAARFGNLGMTRKKLNNLVKREFRKRQRRVYGADAI